MEIHKQNSVGSLCFSCRSASVLHKNHFRYFAGEDSQGKFIAKAWYCGACLPRLTNVFRTAKEVL